jgi:hypothetical protein
VGALATTQFELMGQSLAQWAASLTERQIELLDLWISNGRVVNEQLRGNWQLGTCPRRAEQVACFNEIAREVMPGGELWRGQLITSQPDSWREPTYLCVSLDRQVAWRFSRSAHGYRYVDDPAWRPQTLLRIIAGENLLAVPLHAAMDDGAGAREQEVILLPCRLTPVSSCDDVVTAVASDSIRPAL